MAAINTAKLLTASVVAGVVMNASEYVLNEIVLAEEMQSSFEAMNIASPGGREIGMFIVITFVIAYLTMWLYAVLRDRYGAGPATAVRAGTFVWALVYAAPTAFFEILGMMSMRAATTNAVWTFAEMALATVAGAFFYKD